MKIEVTEEDIKLGQKESCYMCPIARAIERTTKSLWGVRGEFAFRASSPDICVDLPDAAQNFISLFDSGCPVEPFTFEIEL